MRLLPLSSNSESIAAALRFAATWTLRLAVISGASAFGQNTTWQGPGGAEWGDPANWSTGIVPSAADTAVAIANTSAVSGNDLAIALTPTDAPFAVGSLSISTSLGENTVTLGSLERTDDVLSLSTTGSSAPSLDVAGGILKLNAQITGIQGFTKSGVGTLSLRDNPAAQNFSGVIGLAGGTLAIGGDSNLGAATNRLSVTSSSTLLADSIVPSDPVSLNASRAISISSSSATLTVGSKDRSGNLEIKGPISGAGRLDFNGVGKLVLSGNNTHTSALTYRLTSGAPITNSNRSSELSFEGPQAMLSGTHGLSLPYGSGNVTNSTITSRINLGGQSRVFRYVSFNTSGLSSLSSNSTFVIEFLNGSLSDAGTLDSTMSVSARGSGMRSELRLPAETKLAGRLAIGEYSASTTVKTNEALMRIGTNATFNLSSLGVGLGISGRIDALAAGSTLKVRNLSGNGRVSSIDIGNFAGVSAPRADAVIDLLDGAIDILADRVSIGNGTPNYPATAFIKFGAGIFDVATLTIPVNAGGPAQADFGVVQSGGSALLPAVTLGAGNVTGNATFSYQLRGGSLSLGNFFAQGGVSGTIRRRLDWSGGVIRNYPGRTGYIDALNPVTSPLDILFSGTESKVLEVDGNQSVSIGDGARLISDASVVLSKTGNGTLNLGGSSTLFAGTLRHEAGTLSVGLSNRLSTINAGAFVWSAGTLACDLSTSNSTSDRIVLLGAFTKGIGPAASRILSLRSSLGNGFYTLATYASTDLTLADLVVRDVRPGYSAELAIAPTALSVSLAPETPFAIWRRTKFAAASNNGPTASNTGSATDLADPDGDGRPNLMEYATGTEPLAADINQVTIIAATPANRLALTFNRVEDVYLRYTVQASASAAGPWDEVVFTSTGAGNMAGPITVEDTVSLADFPTRFLRLQVTRLPAPGIP